MKKLSGLDRLLAQHDYPSEPWTFPVFSYGINANIDSLKLRCPSWDGTWTLAKLPKHRMEFSKQYPGANKRTYCNVHEDSNDHVWGALVWLDWESFIGIDGYEGFPEHYQRKRVEVEIEITEGKVTDRLAVPSWVYVSDHTGSAAPPVSYYLGVLNGLHGINAPNSYIQNVIRRCADRWIGQGSSKKQGSMTHRVGTPRSAKRLRNRLIDTNSQARPTGSRVTLPREMWAEPPVGESDPVLDLDFTGEEWALLRKGMTV